MYCVAKTKPIGILSAFYPIGNWYFELFKRKCSACGWNLCLFEPSLPDDRKDSPKRNSPLFTTWSMSRSCFLLVAGTCKHGRLYQEELFTLWQLAHCGRPKRHGKTDYTLLDGNPECSLVHLSSFLLLWVFGVRNVRTKIIHTDSCTHCGLLCHSVSHYRVGFVIRGCTFSLCVAKSLPKAGRTIPNKHLFCIALPSRWKTIRDNGFICLGAALSKSQCHQRAIVLFVMAIGCQVKIP